MTMGFLDDVGRRPDWIRDGVPVIYNSSPGPEHEYAGTVDGQPWLLGEHTWVVRLRDMESRYRNGERSTVSAAACSSIRKRYVPSLGDAELIVILTRALLKADAFERDFYRICKECYGIHGKHEPGCSIDAAFIALGLDTDEKREAERKRLGIK